MASLADVYGDEFANEMKNKKYPQLNSPPPPPPPPLTPEEIAQREERKKKDQEELHKYFNSEVKFGDHIKIRTMCYATFPCKHWYNRELLSSTEIYKLLKDADYISNDKLTKEQNSFIKHLEYSKRNT
jgi:hypothetical protein